jgi:hypothetical protein
VETFQPRTEHGTYRGWRSKPKGKSNSSRALTQKVGAESKKKKTPAEPQLQPPSLFTLYSPLQPFLMRVERGAPTWWLAVFARAPLSGARSSPVGPSHGGHRNSGSHHRGSIARRRRMGCPLGERRPPPEDGPPALLPPRMDGGVPSADEAPPFSPALRLSGGVPTATSLSWKSMYGAGGRGCHAWGWSSA